MSLVIAVKIGRPGNTGRLGIEKNPLIQCAKRLGDQEELMLEAWEALT